MCPYGNRDVVNMVNTGNAESGPSDFSFMWSFWDSDPLVSRSWRGGTTTVAMEMPPIAVAHLAAHNLVAIIGNYAEFGSENLRLYSYSGEFIRSYKAPDLGKDAHFGAIAQTAGGVQVVVGCYCETRWLELAGEFSFDHGSVARLHRSY